MVKVIFSRSDVETEIYEGDTLLNIALENDIDISHSCGGNAVCGSCRVRFLKGNNEQDVTAEEYDLLEEEEIEEDIRLACCYIVKEDIIVDA